jgi:hypothetical protein
VCVCRLSYAVSRQWIKEPYKDVKAMIQGVGEEEFARVTNYIFHDAVQAIAALWYKAWRKFVS